jgi:hypothetical protein
MYTIILLFILCQLLKTLSWGNLPFGNSSALPAFCTPATTPIFLFFAERAFRPGSRFQLGLLRELQRTQKGGDK